MSDQEQLKRDIATELSEMLQMDPLEEATKAAARQAALRKEEEKAARIKAAEIPRLREFEARLKRNVSDQEIDARLQRHVGSEGENRDLLPAQRTKERVEERLRYASEMMDRTAPDASALSREWSQHVEGLNLSAREEIRYTNEAQGKQLTSDELNDLEARSYAYSGESDGVHGPSQKYIEELIATAKSMNNWPPPELHTGPGSRQGPEKPSFRDFERLCRKPPDRANQEAEAQQSQAVTSGRAFANASPRGGTLVGSEPSDGRQARLLAVEKTSGGLDAPRRRPGMLRRIATSLATPIIWMTRRLEVEEPMRAPPQARVARNRRTSEARANADQRREDTRDRMGATADLMGRTGSQSSSKHSLHGVLGEGDVIAEKAGIWRLQNGSSQKRQAGVSHANPPSYEASLHQNGVTTNAPRTVASLRSVSPVAPSVDAGGSAATAARSKREDTRDRTGATADLMERTGSQPSSKHSLHGVLDEGDVIANEHWRIAGTSRISISVPEKTGISRLQNRSSQSRQAGVGQANPPSYDASQRQYGVTKNAPRTVASVRSVSPVAPSVDAGRSAATAARSALVASRAGEHQRNDLSI